MITLFCTDGYWLLGYSYMLSGHLNYGAETLRAFLQASGAFYAFFLGDHMNQSFTAADCLDGASPGANATAGAFLG